MESNDRIRKRRLPRGIGVPLSLQKDTSSIKFVKVQFISEL